MSVSALQTTATKWGSMQHASSFFAHHSWLHAADLRLPSVTSACWCVLLCRLNEAQQSAFQDITNVANERRQLSDELESLRSQFKAYQKVKTREISSLDHRVRILLQSQAVAGTMHPDDHTSSLLSPGHKPLPSRCVSLG